MSRLSITIGPVLILCIGAVTVASAQSASPFANKKKKQAWETAPTAPAPSPVPVQQALPVRPAPSTAPAYASPPTAQAPQAGSYSSGGYNYAPPKTSPFAAPKASPVNSNEPTMSGGYYPGRAQAAKPTSPFAPKAGSTPSYQAPAAQMPTYQGGAYQGGPYQGGAYGGPQQQTAQTRAGQGAYYGNTAPKQSWKDKLGLGRLATMFTGGAKIGAAATDREDWDMDFVADAHLDFEVSSITQGGLEYGVNLGARAQYDRYRRGFGGRLPDCPPTEAGCTSVLVDGVPTALRGHTGQFYTFGPDDAKEGQVALESAHLFLRSAYGDVTIGRDDGAAYLFSLGAPSLLGVGASNSSVDYTGLDSVKTVNDASGFSEKVTYTSPRLLGDTVGVGVQIGASYALNARACGVDYCVRRNDETGTLSPDLKDIMEAGLSLDRTFDNGLKVEATGTYARGSEDSGLAGLDDLSAYNAGVEITLEQWTLGGSWLKSNNGLENGDYEAWDTGLTWKPSDLGFTLGYGQATDSSVNLKSNQAMFGVTYVFDKFTVGTGVQYQQRETARFDGALVGTEKDSATALFIEGGFKF